METFSSARLRDFIGYCYQNEMTRAITRRTAHNLFKAAMDVNGDFTLSYEEYDKMTAYLQLPDEAVRHYSSATAVYAFDKLLNTIRRRLRGDFTPLPASSTPSSAPGSQVD